MVRNSQATLYNAYQSFGSFVRSLEATYNPRRESLSSRKPLPPTWRGPRTRIQCSVASESDRQESVTHSYWYWIHWASNAVPSIDNIRSQDFGTRMPSRRDATTRFPPRFGRKDARERCGTGLAQSPRYRTSDVLHSLATVPCTRSCCILAWSWRRSTSATGFLTFVAVSSAHDSGRCQKERTWVVVVPRYFRGTLWRTNLESSDVKIMSMPMPFFVT